MFIKTIKNWFRGKYSCHHKENNTIHQYISQDGCPMVYFHCNDCGYNDHGPVIMGEIPSDWGRRTTVLDGKEVWRTGS